MHCVGIKRLKAGVGRFSTDLVISTLNHDGFCGGYEGVAEYHGQDGGYGQR